MNLSQMRDIDAADPIGTLGPRVTPAPTPAPQPVKRADGFIVGPDGKLSTDLPDPTVPVWHMPTAAPADDDYPPVAAPAELPPDCCAREPLKVGDRVRWLKSGHVFEIKYANGMAGNTKYRHDAIEDPNPICWHKLEGKEWERVK